MSFIQRTIFTKPNVTIPKIKENILNKMSDKTKVFATPAVKSKVNSKRPSLCVPATSRKVPQPPSTVAKPGSSKDRFVAPHPRPRNNKNATIMSDPDASMMRADVACAGMPDFDNEHRQVAYGKFLRAMLQVCLVDEKIEREETELDVQMMQLAERFQNTVTHLDKTCRKLDDISFAVEHKRLNDLKSNHCDESYKITEESNTAELMSNLSAAEESRLNHLETKNIDFGYDKDSGHKQLLDAVNEAIDGLEQIKKQSNLDPLKIKEYEDSERNLTEVEKDRFDLERLRSDFDKKFPIYSEQLIKEVSDKISEIMQDDKDGAGGDDDDSD